MNILVILCLWFFILAPHAAGETDMEPIYEFAQGFGAKDAVQSAYESALEGTLPDADRLLDWLKAELAEPLGDVMSVGSKLAAPVLLLAMARSTVGRNGGACFLLKLMLMLMFSELALMSLDASQECLRSAKAFSDVAAPGVAALLTAMGMTGTSALISPAAALAGGIAEDMFLRYGLPMCRIALATAIAGNLSQAIDLNRFTLLLRKAANWGAGLATTLFTALLALQGGAAESLDGVGLRTAKFAVDSASPVIGSGVSDAWKSYISGMLVTKNALGISGITALLAAGVRPVVFCAAAMLLLNLVAALLEVFGEKETARAAVQAAGICQMALSLATCALVIVTVLLGAAMSAGRNLAA